jgi:hypothetical protein
MGNKAERQVGGTVVGGKTVSDAVELDNAAI